jgi:two-component system, OmpR family, sensor histidine kinase SenX3
MRRWSLRRRDRFTAERSSLADLQQSTEELRTRMSAAEAGLEALTEGIVVFDRRGDLAYVNGAARDLIGRRFGHISELAPVVLRTATKTAFDTRGSTDLEFETAGRVVQAAVIGSADREDVGAVLVLRDVTAARRNERIRRDFVANASHELKTPVSSITALAEALHEASGNDQVAMARFVTLLQEESQRLARLVTDLLDLSRLEGELPPAETVDLARVMSEEIERIRTRADAAGIRFVVELADDVKVPGSESDLGLLVHNLLDNAIHYSPEGGDVAVRLQSDDKTASLMVSDTGIGIASRDLDRIFERFYRADPARSRQTGGTGLGLSIVKHVVEAHGGDVRVESVLGSGSTFTVRLPLADPAPA